MSTEFEDKYLDVLQNLESSILQVYSKQPDLTDFNVDRVIDALVRNYQDEQSGRAVAGVPSHLTSTLEQELYQQVKAMCDLRLGRDVLEDENDQEVDLGLETKTPDEIIACLKRIRQSIKRWTKVGGRRGYLDFIRQYVR